ncbi:bifunctional diaminohydroxyphosphoribosylaminopyrimidine deaminase/5-amino-6-(5-phosphoribosylamino)uracil reductase RibD [Candidatus Gracilibacteria bacterium]|nr:bifunctional diaminohydroxyphosphoribosylaminopyrimidine deaminase/5-amino-6-(5-phosphoribosylamino)uracil reductase RibD [Candidatus Gracilibacteria bacterium]
MDNLNPSRSPFFKGGGFMDHAADLASQVDPHLTAPNPRVGCVVVCDGEILASGVHEKFGEPHAEVNSISSLNPGSRVKEPGFWDQCEIYITLEPCDHFQGKKTPSCTELLLKHKPKKVIVGSLDPQFGGKNLEKLKKAGIEVVLEKNEKCEELNPFFAHFVKTKMPYVTVKMAQSLDGRVTKKIPGSGIPEPGIDYISNEISRQKVHEMRAQYSALLTTVKTILADDPQLNCRLDNPPSLAKREMEGDFSKEDLNPPAPLYSGAVPLFQRGRNTSDPQIIVLGKKSDIPPSARIFLSSPLGRGSEGEGNRKIHFFDTHDLKSVLAECAKMGIDSIMTECGPTVATELLKSDLVDEVQLFVAPEIFGKGKDAFLNNAILQDFHLHEVENLQGDVWMRFVRK